MKQTSQEPMNQPRRHFLNWEATKRVGMFLREPIESPACDDLPQMAAYEVHEHLGTGAFGSVYMAIPKAQPESVIAVKLFKVGPSGGTPPTRVLRELDLLSALQLPCVPRIYDFGIDQGRFFIATDVVRGASVDRFCEERGLDREQRVKLLVEIASAVQQLHEFGVIHRDLKPSNIMITHDGRPVLIDLGISTMLESAPGDTVTSEGLPIGSPGYMAPEQARGDRLAITTRSDVYSLGATACHLLTGRTPHDTDAPLHEVIRRVAEDAPRHPQQLDPSMPKALAAVLAKATAREPKDRFTSAAELATFLTKWLDGEPIAIARPSLVSHVAFRVRRNPWLTATSVLASLAFFAAVFLGFAAAAESRLASEQAGLAQEQSDLAEARRHFAVEREQFAKSASEHLQRVRGIVARFLSSARDHADAGSFAEAFRIIYGIDHLLESEDFRQPELAAEHRQARLTTVIDALHAIYRTSEFGGTEILDRVRMNLEELEQLRMETQLDEH